MKRYLIDEEEITEGKFWDRFDEEVRAEIDQHYDDLLDEIYPDVKIGVCTFSASQILAKCDPIAYRCGIDDFVNQYSEDYKQELENDGWACIGPYDFKVIEVDE